MDFSALFAFLVANLGVGAAGGILIYAVAAGLDVVAGVALALKRKTFDRAKLGSFLLTQVGAVRTLIVVGSVVAAVASAVVSIPLAHTSLRQLLAVLEGVALAAALAGSAANFAAVAGDLIDKAKALFGIALPVVKAA